MVQVQNAMEITEIDELIAMQLVSYDDAANTQRMIFWLSIGIATMGILLIFITNDVIALTIGFFSFLTIVVIVWLQHKLGSIRAFAEQVRKATLLSRGLGAKLSSHEMRTIKAKFSGNSEKVSSKINQEYYASNVAHGPKRLVGMLEESAFWSQFLLKKCATKSWLYFLGAVAVTVFIVLSFLFVSKDQYTSNNLNFINVVMSGITLLISRSFMGNALAYSGAERAVARILERLQILKKTDDDKEMLPDLLMILGDYNSAVESAPLFLPGMYKRNKTALDKLWTDYS